MSKYIKKCAYRPNTPKHMISILDSYYEAQKECFGYIKYYIRYDSGMKEYLVDVLTKPAYYPSDLAVGLAIVDRKKTQKLIKTKYHDLSESELLKFMRENYGRKQE